MRSGARSIWQTLQSKYLPVAMFVELTDNYVNGFRKTRRATQVEL